MSALTERLEGTWGEGADEGQGDNPIDVAVFLYSEACKCVDGDDDAGGANAEADIRSLLQCCIDACLEVVKKGGCDAVGAKVLLSDAKVLLGRALEWKDPIKALGTFREAITAHPASAEAHLQLGRSLYRRAASQSDLDHAEEVLRESIRLAVEDDKHGNENQEYDDAEEEDDDGTAPEAQRLLARLLCQSPGRKKEAFALLSTMGYTHTLAHELTCFDFLRGESAVPMLGEPTPPTDNEKRSGAHVSAFDQVLPPEMLAHLQAALSPNAPFWREHRYGSPSTGFFSYQIPLPMFSPDWKSKSRRGRSSLEEIIVHLRATAAESVPDAANAKFAEVWAHSRSHSSGHKLHFDYIQHDGQTDHPIVSTVLYLTSPCGGPTLVTNQVMPKENSEEAVESDPSSLTHNGWAVVPSPNRMLVFKGTLLHCVLPGVGPRPQRMGTAVLKRKREDTAAASTTTTTTIGDDDSRRLTFMVALWRDDPGAPPFPGPSAVGEKTWPASFLVPLERPCVSGRGERHVARRNMSAVRSLKHVWEEVAQKGNGRAGKGQSSAKLQESASGGIDLLSEDCFTDFSALNSGLVIAGPSSGPCSLNCGRTCPACKEAASRKAVKGK